MKKMRKIDISRYTQIKLYNYIRHSTELVCPYKQII